LLLLRMKCCFLRLQISDHPGKPCNRNLIANGQEYSPVMLDLFIEFVAVVAHGPARTVNRGTHHWLPDGKYGWNGNLFTGPLQSFSSASRTARASWICLRVRPISAALGPLFRLGSVKLRPVRISEITGSCAAGTTPHSPGLLFWAASPTARHGTRLSKCALTKGGAVL
jgi:hypothetical protein